MAERNPSDTQAAFGVFPQLKRNRSKQDREAAKNVPIDLARGAVAGVLGAPGDIESLVRMLPYLDEKTILPTSEDIEKKLPFRSDTPVSRAATGLGTLGGGFYYGPGSPLKVVGALPRAIKHGAEEFAKASVAGAPHVIKPKGGNWLSGGEKEQIRTPEGDLSRLRAKVGYSLEPEKQLKKLTERYTPEALATLTPDIRVGVERAINETRDAVAINKWIDGNLKNYVKKEMGTPDDPVRKLAEEGIIHTPLRDTEAAGDFLRAQRVAEGFPAEGMGRSELARRWEDTADDSIRVTTAGAIQDQANTGAKLEKARAELEAYKEKINEDFITLLKDKGGLSDKDRATFDKFPFFQKAEILGDTKYQELQGNINELLARESGFEKRAGELNPFVAKLDPETRLYAGGTYDLGFDHIIDVLRQDVQAGLIRPDQLNKVSMEQAVRRTYEYDQEMAKKMAEAAIKQTQGFPTYKEYPEGYRWIELAKPEPAKALPEGWSEPVAKGNALQTRSPNGDIVLGFDLPDLVKNIYKRHPETPGNPYTALEDALKYEGETMGHCVGGYCPDVLSGNTRIFSLRDAKGEPHVTVETRPVDRNRGFIGDQKPVGDEYYSQKNKYVAGQNDGSINPNLTFAEWWRSTQGIPEPEVSAERIVQIKGKQNAKPKEQYLPFVQDFVKSGNWSDIGDFRNTGLIREGDQLMTPAEHSDWLLKQLDVPPPAPEGMKRGGKVSISNNPDTMMLEVNNRKMAKGGKAVKFVEDVAPAAIEKLAMMFGNKLPLNMNSAEIENLAKRFPEPVVDRVNMAHKDVLKRTPELQEAAARIEAGDMSADEYARLVQRHKPVTPYESVPAPASREEILAALSKTSREAEGLPRKETYFGKPSSTLKEGDPVGLRLDIPSYNQANTWVVTAHGPRKSPVSGGAGTRIGYEPVAMATDVDFSVSPKAALGIAKGAEKNTIATMEGKWKPTSSDEAFTLAKQYLKNPEWRQVGMDPERHSFFYDRETMAPVINAEEVIQIGPLVLAKNPKYGNPKDFKYADGGDVHMAGGGLSKLLKGALKAEPEIMKASEALGKIEGRPLVITQADRTKVGEGYLGGPGFSSLQLTEPEYRAAEAAWGVKNAGTAKMILGGGKKAGENPVYTTMIGSPTQHQSNQMVFDKLYGDFKKAAKKGGLPPELRDKINDRLVRAVDKEGNPVFPADIDILDKKFKDIANTFDRRSIAGHLMGGVQVGGKKGQIIDYDKIIRDTTDPALIDVPSGSLGNRLFTLSGGIIDRPDLHPAFPTILQGEDLGVSFSPVAREILMRDFIDKTMREKKRVPGYMDYTRGHPPSQLITEDILTEMQKLGLKEGGEVKKPADGIKQPAAYINGDEFVNAAKKYGIKDSMNNLNKIVDLVNKGLSVDDAARQVADSGMHKAAGGAISGDDLIIEERPL